MQELRAEIAKQVGCEPPENFLFNGEFFHWRSDGRRDKNPHFWAVGYTWQYKGNENYTAVFGSFREDSRHQVSSYDLKGQSKPFQQAHNAAVDAINKKAAEQKEQRHKDCAMKWEPIYLDSPTAQGHPYLERKKIVGGRACVDKYHNLLIPIQDVNGTFTGVQMVRPDGTKLFATGTKIQGCFHSVTMVDLKDTPLVYLCEGYATGMSIHQAVGGAVVCAMNCGNLLPVAKSLRAVNPEIRIVLCADDDRETKGNPGKKKAEELARKLNNVLVRFPKFTVKDSRLTDFNDLHVMEDLERVVEQLAFTPSDFVEVTPLGLDGNRFYYFSTQTNTLRALAPNEHNRLQLTSLAREAYWTQRFPNSIGKEGWIDFNALADELFAVQREKGHFNPADVRGTGAWIDQGRAVYNMGKHVMDGGRQVPVQNFNAQSKYHYQASNQQGFDPDAQLTPEERTRIDQAFAMLNYKTPQDHVYLVGHLVCAHICGALDWRPHVWLTGPRGSGKSWILGKVADLLMTEIDRASTEAGIRQTLKTNSIPYIIDEAEPNNRKDRARMDGVLELIRQSSSRAHGRIVKGSSGGEAVTFKINSTFLLASIQTSLDLGADSSRFTVIEMLDTKTQPREQFMELQRTAHDFETLGPKLAATCVHSINQILKSINDAAKHMTQNQTFLEQRQIDQHATLIGAYAWLTGRHVNTCCPPPLNTNDQEHQTVDDAQDCLDALLQIGNRDGRTIAQLLESNSHDALAFFGVKTVTEDSFFVASRNIHLRDSLSKMTHFKNYADMLRRTTNFVDNRKLRISGQLTSGVILKMDTEKAPF